MPSGFVSEIDWARQWMAHLMPFAERIGNVADWRALFNAIAEETDIRNYRNFPIRFVEQSDLPAGMAYEAFIGETGCVPTRNNLHDFFNGLVWLRFPRVKARLNALQAAEIAKNAASTLTGAPAVRGRLRDAITIFDENAAILLVSDPWIVEALRAHDWNAVLWAGRKNFDVSWSVSLFGHALMEKLAHPFKSITAHAWPLAVGKDFFSLPFEERTQQLDFLIAPKLSSTLRTSDFSPLPVLGIPGWWENQDEAFYADQSVFRPKRIRSE
jgi:hypothetical protein